MKTIICIKCNASQPINHFSFKIKKRGIRHTICKTCHALYRKAHYEANKDYYIKRARKWWDKQIPKLQKFVVDYLKSHPCVDCGEDDLVVLDFDHVRGKKFMGVSEMVRRGFSIKTILTEIEKCEIRCSNCHRKRTSKKSNNWYKNTITG